MIWFLVYFLIGLVYFNWVLSEEPQLHDEIPDNCYVPTMIIFALIYGPWHLYCFIQDLMGGNNDLGNH